MAKSVSINDIASELGLSRNTVSKALNGKEVPEKTRARIIAKAIELGYKNYDILTDTSFIKKDKKILLLSSKSLLSANFYVSLIRGIENETDISGIEFMQYIYRPYSEFETLKQEISIAGVDGIICIEFFNSKVIKEILSLGLPIVFFDFAHSFGDYVGNYDILMMENFEPIREVCSKLIKAGLTKFSFVGNLRHCRGFYERFLGMKEALFDNGVPFSESLCILKDSQFNYGDPVLLAEEIKRLPEMPECFVCTNDFSALALMQALKSLHLPNANDIHILGFDNIPETRFSSPPLSTIHVDKVMLGKRAVEILVSRINKKGKRNNIYYIRSNFVKRQTTPLLN